MNKIKLLFVVLMLVTGIKVYSQDKERIVGKWKVVTMYDDKLYFSIENDSIFFKEAHDMKDSLSAAKIDSIENDLRIILKDVFEGAGFEFYSDMTYKDISPMKGERSGKYLVDEKEKTITTFLERKLRSTGEVSISEEIFRYKFDEGNLILLKDESSPGPNIELKRIH